MAGTTTIRDVAREAHVSIATVSYVLNDSRRVTEETRQRVLGAVTRLGYRANITARNLQANETRLFAYTWQPSPPDQFNPILDSFLQAAVAAAARRGYRFLVFPTATIADELATYQALILEGQVDGFVLSNTHLEDERVRCLLDAGFPFVAFGRSNPGWDFSWVDVDGTAGVRMAVEHLLAQGHRRISCLSWPAPSLAGQHRLNGFLAAMQKAGLAIDPAWIERAENTYADAYASTRRLLALPPDRRPTAIVTMSDLMAIGVINAAWDAGAEPGRELAVIGFDDAPVARFLRPSLTSLRQPIAEVGERLVGMLVDLCRAQRSTEHEVLLQPELIVRASSNFHMES